MQRSFRYRLWTNANQERELGIMLETHRRLYNECLAQRKTAYEQTGVGVSYYAQCLKFTEDRQSNPYYFRLNVTSAQITMRQLEKSFAGFFRRCKEGDCKPGYPRFKARDRFNSFSFRYTKGWGDGCRLIGNRLRVQNVGTIRVNLHRPVEGTIKAVSLKREGRKWYAYLSCELPDVPLADNSKPPVGIDVGLTHFLTTSDGAAEPNPRYLKTALPKLRRAGRAVARKKKGGKNRRKAVRRLQKVHARVKNLRREHHFQVACRLILACSFIAAEALNIKGMLANGRLSRAISDAGWSGFLNVLRCKAESAGVEFVAVDPRGTSQTCVCGQEVRKSLSDRWHDCPSCGLSLPRDHVSAQVILARGLAARTGPTEANVDQQVKRPPRSRLLFAEME